MHVVKKINDTGDQRQIPERLSLCVFFDTTTSLWDDTGCRSNLKVDEASGNITSVICECFHLTDFTVDVGTVFQLQFTFVKFVFSPSNQTSLLPFMLVSTLLVLVLELSLTSWSVGDVIASCNPLGRE